MVKQRSLYRLSDHRGMTLMEVMTAVMIVGIISAMAFPKFETAIDRLEIRSSNRDLTSALKLARSMAITDKQQYAVALDNTNKTFTIFKDMTNPSAPALDASDSVIKVDTFPSQMFWIGSDVTNNVIAFRPNGSANFTGGGNFWTIAYTEHASGLGVNNVLASTGRAAQMTYLY